MEIGENDCVPSLLDVVEIDGKLAQVRPSEECVVFLGESFDYMNEINWESYRFAMAGRDENVVNCLLINGKISQDELNNVHWGKEQEKHPYLRGQVKFFGRYYSKE